MLAHRAQRPVGQAHFAARQLLAGRRGGLGDVGGADGAEQLAFAARLGGDA